MSWLGPSPGELGTQRQEYEFNLAYQKLTDERALKCLV